MAAETTWHKWKKLFPNRLRAQHSPVHIFAQLLGKLKANRLLPDGDVHFEFLRQRVRQASGKNVVQPAFHVKTFILTPKEQGLNNGMLIQACILIFKSFDEYVNTGTQ